MHAGRMVYVLVGAAITLLTIAVILVDLSDTHDHWDTHLFTWGIILYLLSILVAWLAFYLYYSDQAKQVERIWRGPRARKANKRSIPSVFAHWQRVYMPMYLATVFALLGAGLFLVFHLDKWAVYLGSLMVGIGVVAALLLLVGRHTNLSRLAAALDKERGAQLRALMSRSSPVWQGSGSG